MADYTYYVNPAATTGGDGTADALTGGTCAYQTLNAALTAREGGTSGDTFTFRCSGDTGNWVDTTGVNVSTGWTSGVTVIIEGYNGNYTGKQLGNTYDNTDCYALEPSPTATGSLTNSFAGVLTVKHLQVDNKKASSYYYTIYNSSTSSSSVMTVDSCRIRCSKASSSYHGEGARLHRGDTIKNCTIEGNGISNALAIGIYQFTYLPLTCVNNTIYNFYTGIKIAAYDQGTFQNNVIAGATDDWAGTDVNNAGTYSYNADSNDGDRPNGATNFVTLSTTLTDELTDAANGDLTVAGNGASNNIWDAGTSGGSIPTVDIIGTSRSDYAIGAWEYAASGTTINATADTLTITDYNCTVETTANTTIDATLDTLTLTEYNATVSADTSISATADSLTILDYIATVSADTNLTTTSEALTFTEYNVAVNTGIGVTATVDPLTITSYNVSISLDVGVSATSEALTITEYNAVVTTGANVAATLDTLTITDYNVSVGYDTSITATADSLTITEYNATIQANVDTDITAGLEALTFTDYNVTIASGTGISATVDALTLTEYNATIGAVINTNISAGIEALTLTEYNSTVSAPGTTTLTAQDIANIEAAFKNAVRSVLFVDNNT